MPRRLHLLIPPLLLLALATVVALLLVPTLPRTQEPLLIDFYPSEHNERLDYQFSEPQGFALLPGEGGPALLTLRLWSPPPLPERSVTATLDSRPLFVHPLGDRPQTWRLLLPPGSGRERLLGLATEEARIAGDPRSLGLLLQTVQSTPLSPAPPWLWALPVALAPLTLTLGGAGLLAAARRRSWHAVLLVALLAAFVLLLDRYAIARHERFGSNGYDLGQYDQTLWLLSNGYFPYSTTMGLHILGNHGAVILWLLAPLYWLWSDVRALLLFQVAVVALGALPLYLLGRERGAPWLGLLAAAAFLLHPATHNLVLFDFHPDAIAGTALLWVLYAAERRRWPLVFGAALVVLACKENFALTIAWLGLWLLLRREWRPGLLLLVAGLAWFAVMTRLVQPFYNGTAQALHLSRFERYGDTLGAMVATVLANPLLVLRDLAQPEQGRYLLWLLLPFALLPLLRPHYLLPALPPLMLNLLSGFSAQRQLAYHYDALIVPVAALALLMALLWLHQRLPRRQGLLVAGTSLLLLLGTGYVYRTADTQLADLRSDLRSSRERHRVWRYVVGLVPPDVGISAQSRLQPHLTHRQQAFLFPNPFANAAFYNPAAMPFAPDVGYIAFDTRLAAPFELSAEQQLALLGELKQRDYRELLDLDGVVLLERTSQ